MGIKALLCAAFGAAAAFAWLPAEAHGADRVTTKDGVIDGAGADALGVRMFRGIAFAKSPVGDLRWRAPQPLEKWDGVRSADRFGAACVQTPLAYVDLVSRSNGISEDCLYLNVWTPAKDANTKLPVLVYIYGGGFTAGDGSELRYDGGAMAAKGMVTVTMNYRLGIFGFMASPELSRESGYNGSGNYAFMDQQAALRWVQQNIAAFGGDPARVTIGGESAGSISVSALMASPLSKGLFNGAIGESGSIMGALDAAPLAQVEKNGADFATRVGAPSLAALRAMSTDQVTALAAAARMRFAPSIDGHVLPKPASEIFAAGEQMHVPLLAGSNSQEGGAEQVLNADQPTVENYRKALARLYPDNADAAFAAYPAKTDGAGVLDAAQELASDRFIAYSTWRWVNIASKTGGQPVYYFYFAKPRPPIVSAVGERYKLISVSRNPAAPLSIPPRGATHSAEIEYALGNLDTNIAYAWTAEDRAVSATMQDYFANFVKTGDPNGKGVVKWPTYKSGKRLVIDTQTRVIAQAPVTARYGFMDKLANTPAK